MSFKVSNWAQAKYSEEFGITEEEYSAHIVPKMMELLELCTSMGLPCSIFVTQGMEDGDIILNSGNNFQEVPIENIDSSQIFASLFARHVNYDEFKQLCEDVVDIMAVKAKSNGVE